jgi:hypothetical protein
METRKNFFLGSKDAAVMAVDNVYDVVEETKSTFSEGKATKQKIGEPNQTGHPVEHRRTRRGCYKYNICRCRKGE